MFIYALKSAIVLSLLYLPYVLMLRRETFFRFNRAVLLSILLASLLLPLCNVSVLSLDENPVVSAAQQQMIEIGIPVARMLPDGEEATVQTETRHVTWFGVVAALYIIVAIGLLFIRLRDFARLQRILRTDILWQKELESGITLCCHAGQVPPFSWGRTIVVGEADYEQNGACIVRHESGHILHGHSWDVLLLTAVQLVQWFNPLVWLLGQSLQDVHEYEADDHVLRGGVTLDEYRYLLIQKAVGASPYVFANNFNHSLLKKRIAMMCMKKSNPWKRTKALYAVPVALLALAAFATPEFITASETVSEAIAPDKKPTYVVDGKVAAPAEAETLKPEQLEHVTVIRNPEVIKKVSPQAEADSTGQVVLVDTKPMEQPDQLAEFAGDIYAWLAQNVRYPKEALEWGESGRIFVKFIVEKDGTVSGIQSFFGEKELKGEQTEIQVSAYAPADKQLTPEEEAEQKAQILAARKSLKTEAERVVKAMPQWKPAKHQGKLVRMEYTLPILFRLN